MRLPWSRRAFSRRQVAVYIFGVDFLHSLAASEWLQYAAAATILLASLVAMTKDNLKARLAYSTVSQLSYIVLGAMLATEISVVGGGMHIAMHAFGKITLFFCAGAILVAAHKTEISQMRGIGRVMPITTFAFLIGSLSIIGLPPFGGMWSKWYLALGALDAGKQVMVAVLMISSLLNIAYLLPIPIRGFFCEPGDNPGHGAGVREAPWLLLAPPSRHRSLVLFLPEPVYNLLACMFVARIASDSEEKATSSTTRGTEGPDLQFMWSARLVRADFIIHRHSIPSRPVRLLRFYASCGVFLVWPPRKSQDRKARETPTKTSSSPLPDLLCLCVLGAITRGRCSRPTVAIPRRRLNLSIRGEVPVTFGFSIRPFLLRVDK